MQKVCQFDLNFSEKAFFFVFEILIYFYVNVSSNFVIQEWVDPLSIKRFRKTSTVSYKSSSNDRKVVEKQKSTTFNIFDNFTQIWRKLDWLGYTQSDEKTNRCLVSS